MPSSLALGAFDAICRPSMFASGTAFVLLAASQWLGNVPATCTLTGAISLDDVTVRSGTGEPTGPRLRVHAQNTTTIINDRRAVTDITRDVQMRIERPVEQVLLGLKRRIQFAKGRGRIRRETRLRPLRVLPDQQLRVGVLVGFDERPITTLTLPCRKLRLSDAGPVPRSSNYLQWPPETRWWTRGPLSLRGTPDAKSTKGGSPIPLSRSVPVRLQRENGPWRYVGAGWGDDTKFFGWVRADQLEQRHGVTGGPMRGICGVMRAPKIRRVTLRPGAQLFRVHGDVAKSEKAEPFATVERGRRVRVRAHAVVQDIEQGGAWVRLTSVRSSRFSMWASGTPPCSQTIGVARVQRSDIF